MALVTNTIITIGTLGAGLAATLAGALGLGIAGLTLAGISAKNQKNRVSYRGRSGAVLSTPVTVPSSTPRANRRRPRPRIPIPRGPAPGGTGPIPGSPGGGNALGRRGKRSIHEESAALENVMEEIRAQDVSGCGRRLVCELAATDLRRLTVQELSILNLVGPSVLPRKYLSSGAASGEYRAARGVGEAGLDCGQIFTTCPLSGSQLRIAVLALLP
ncbi:uncharacterized protein [Cherax quadricarinatus]|uniref:uncharacterized protein n=1 Tax=Cherax quadricarinatus TaxID=27406 RepID=UPI00237944E8|nr:uncharacterized protein LOC128701195 [Cherax quadricarinatus]